MRIFLLLCVLCASVVQAQSLEKATELLRQQKYDQARAELDAILKADPGNGRAAALLAATDLQTGFVKSAVARAEILVERDPQNADLHELLGQAYIATREWTKAEKEWRWMVEHRPEAEQSHMQLAVVLMQRDQFPAALAAVSRCLEMNPKRGDAHSLRGNILASLGRLDDAAQAWSLALSIEPADTVALSGLAVYMRNRDPNRALEMARRAVELTRGRNTGPLRVLAMVYQARGEIEQARQTLQRALLLDPNNQAVAAELRALRAPAVAARPVAPATPPPPPPPSLPPIPGLSGLTLGATASDLLPLLTLPQRPSAQRTAVATSYVAVRPPRAADPAPPRESFPVLPLFMNRPVFIYSDVVSRPTTK